MFCVNFLLILCISYAPLQTAEVAILAGAVVVFLLTVAAIACLCYKQRKRSDPLVH